MNKLLKKIAVVTTAGTVLGLVGAGDAFAYSLTNNRPTTISGNSLQGVLNNIKASDATQSGGLLSAANDQSNVALWDVTKSAGSSATLIIELAGFAGSNVFGLYDPKTGTKTQIFEGNDQGNAVVKESASITFTSSGSGYTVKINEISGGAGGNEGTNGNNSGTLTSSLFGFYITSPQGTFFTDDSANLPGQIPHAVVFEGNGNTLSLPGAEINDTSFKADDDWILAWEDLATGGDKDYNDMVLKVSGVGAAVPEPFTMLGAGAAAGFGAFFKRQTAKKQKKDH